MMHMAQAPITLQWGHAHDLAVMERTIWEAPSYQRNKLQWGHDLAVMESR